MKFNATTAVFFYHRLCQVKRKTNTTFTCFRNLNYLCMCDPNHYRAECFGYDRSVDRCSLCLSGGYCLKGKLDDNADFLCLCPRCHRGQMCEFSNELMSFTLDSLTVKDLQTNTKLFMGIYILISMLIFLFGFFTNFCGLLTFLRPKSRQFGVGSSLLLISIVNQCSLLVLLLKIIHIILGTNGTLFNHEDLNLYSCKIISYLLSVLTRSTNWVESVVTIERLLTVFFPTSVILKKPRRALIMSVVVILLVGSMHVHEVLHYRTIADPSSASLNTTICVTGYVQELVSLYNRVNTLIHYFVPFTIQVACITILIIQTTRSRARINSSGQETFLGLLKKQFKTHREHYVTPMIIVFSSLPQIILSFSYACTELKQVWQRYTLLTTYFLSYLPQMLGFILYVLPSTVYYREFCQTIIGTKLVRQQRKSTVLRQENTGMRTKSTKSPASKIVTSYSMKVTG